MRFFGAAILLIVLARSVSAQYFYYSTADSVIYVQYSSFHADTPYYLMRLRDGGRRIEEAAVESPGMIMMTDGIPGEVFAVKYYSPSGHRELWKSTDFGESWGPIPARPAQCNFQSPGRPGQQPGQATVMSMALPNTMYFTSDGWATFDSLEFNQHIDGSPDLVYFIAFGYASGLVYGVKRDGHTICVSSDTTHNWAVGSYMAHPHFLSLVIGAPDEIWGFRLENEVFMARDTGRTVLDSLFVMHPPPSQTDPWYMEIHPTDHPGEAYLLTTETGSIAGNVTQLIVYHIQDYGAHVDSSYYQLVGYHVSGVAARREMPGDFGLMAYPNPFNPTTTISFSLPHAGEVNVKVFDVTGRLVSTLVEGRLESGEHSVVLDGSGVASGIYFVRMEDAGIERTEKIVLMK